MLQRVFLSAVTLFFAFVVSFASGECSALTGFVEAYGVNCVSFTFWTVSLYFFGNVHDFNQLCIKETHSLLYFMTYQAKTKDFMPG